MLCWMNSCLLSSVKLVQITAGCGERSKLFTVFWHAVTMPSLHLREIQAYSWLDKEKMNLSGKEHAST